MNRSASTAAVQSAVLLQKVQREIDVGHGIAGSEDRQGSRALKAMREGNGPKPWQTGGGNENQGSSGKRVHALSSDTT